jgi:hypothetical protein
MLATLPDEPRWTLAHGLAADPATWRRPLDGGLALGHDAAGLIVLCGAPAPDRVVALALAHPDLAIVGVDAPGATAAALAALGRAVDEVTLATLAQDVEPPDLDGAAPLPADAALDHLPPPLADELARLRRDRTVWASWVDDRPVSFACATWRSARWFDAMIDTAPGYRQLGLATIVAAALLHDERAAGRAPAWAARTDDPAPHRLAARLGLTPRDTLWLAAPGGGS